MNNIVNRVAGAVLCSQDVILTSTHDLDCGWMAVLSVEFAHAHSGRVSGMYTDLQVGWPSQLHACVRFKNWHGSFTGKRHVVLKIYGRLCACVELDSEIAVNEPANRCCALQVAWQLCKQSNVELTNESTEALHHLVSHWSILKSNVYTTVKRPAKHSTYTH